MARQNAKTGVVFEKVARGDGKTSVLFSAPDYMREYGLTAVSRTSAGDEVPATVVSCAIPGRCVLLLATLQIAQECVLMCEGVEVARKVFHPRVCQLESAYHTLRHDAVAQLIRDCDGRSRRNGCNVEVLRILRAERPGRIVHGLVEVDGFVRDEIAGDCEIRLLDQAGAEVAQSEPVLMKDVTFAHPEAPGLLRRTVEFSARIEEETESLVVWARFPSGAEGFTVYEPCGFSTLKTGWERRMEHAFYDAAYNLWFKNEHAASDVELEAQSRQTFEIAPLFSVIVPLYNTPADLFAEMADSVLRQSYGNFELLLVNSTPENRDLARLVREYCERDARVRSIDLEENRGITENTNAGISAAKGDFLCFLDHDDLLTPDALYWYVRGINDYPETDLLYCDEDKIEDGKFVNPFFKPDWNPDLLMSSNYVCHLLCVRKSIVDDLEPPTREFDGSQDHNLTFLVSERARNIYHARRVLYHWRIVAGSTAGGIGAKPYALDAGVRAVQGHIDRMGLKGAVGLSSRVRDHYEVVYELEEHPLVSILIPNKDNADMLDRCVRSVFEKSSYDNYEIVIIENNSVEPETFAYYKRLEGESERVKVVYYDGAFNYAAINNLGSRESRGDYLLLLNNDTEVIAPDWIERMLALCMREGTGAVGARLLFPDGTIQHAGVTVLANGPQHIGRFDDGDFPGYACMYAIRQDVNAVTGACMMTSREVYERIGGLDEQFAVAYNDIDYCFALRDAGLLVVYEPAAELYHYESVSRGDDNEHGGSERFAREQGMIRTKWPSFFSGVDHYRNPHFESGGGGAYYRGFE